MEGQNIDLNQAEQQAQIEAMKKQIMFRLLTKEAYERLNRVRMVNPQLVALAESYIMQIAQTGYNKKLGDSEIKDVLRSLSGGKKEFRMKRV